MAHMITAECINCSACAMECPVRAISSAASQFVVDPDVCMDCAGYFAIPRCVWVCPVNACAPARTSYLTRAATLADRGTDPLRLVGVPPEQLVEVLVPSE